ncbi:DUF4326 domain-containing protein [Nocardiopsis synnemataformans]|uniref:DUF4326 domain-containing protein n=1 Tax=Nocardiopsis synnemataformans TaxID=61305 RepID=UPI003EB81F1A
MTAVRPGQLYERCGPRGGQLVRIDSVYGHRAQVTNADGSHSRPLLLRSLHPTGQTDSGTDRRTGYRLVAEPEDLRTTGAPRRIQRRRTRGWRMPESAIYVGRPSRWGNPWPFRTRGALARVPALDGSAWEWEGRISTAGTTHPYCHPDGHITRHEIRYMTRAECAEMYRRALTSPTREVHLYQGYGLPWLTVEDARRELAGRDLACWCPLPEEGQPDHCHAAVLLSVANGLEV